MKQLLRRTDGTAALEFALISPLFIMIVLSAIAYGIYLSAAHSLQQMAADAARNAVAGLDTSERVARANQSIEKATIDATFLKRDRMAINLIEDPQDSSRFVVRLSYDARDLPIWQLYAFALPDPTITRTASVRFGGR